MVDVPEAASPAAGTQEAASPAASTVVALATDSTAVAPSADGEGTRAARSYGRSYVVPYAVPYFVPSYGYSYGFSPVGFEQTTAPWIRVMGWATTMRHRQPQPSSKWITAHRTVNLFLRRIATPCRCIRHLRRVPRKPQWLRVAIT